MIQVINFLSIFVKMASQVTHLFSSSSKNLKLFIMLHLWGGEKASDNNFCELKKSRQSVFWAPYLDFLAKSFRQTDHFKSL